MLIREALNFAVDKLKKVNIDSYLIDARILLKTVLVKSTEYIIISLEETLTIDQAERYFQLIKRRCNHEPIAYIIGYKEFYGRDFFVDQRVLIPRSDTEILIDNVIAHIKNKDNIKILDLGTGSGIIAITLASEIPSAQIIATDISDDAIEVAKYNSLKHNVCERVKFVKSNWFENLAIDSYDIIISNPPYISKDEKELMTSETIKYEPPVALFASNSGIYNYEIIIGNALKYLSKQGSIFLEIGFKQSELISDIVSRNNLKISDIFKDIQGHDRVIKIVS